MQMINYELVLESGDTIEGITIDEILSQSYDKDTSQIEIMFKDEARNIHDITSENYQAHNKLEKTFYARCLICGDTKHITISDLDDLKLICKYHSKNITSFDKIEAIINEFHSTKDFFLIINAVNDNNPFSVCDICSYHRPYEKEG